MNSPLISIVTIVYNGERYLEQTIQSVLNQTYKNFEYIVIDGGSSDGTIDIIKKYNDRIAYWKSEKDEGISDAFNKGILKCKGDIIGLINSDDWYELDAFENVINNYHKADILHGKLQCWTDDKKGFVFTANSNLLAKDMTVNHNTMFIKKNIYASNGMFKLNYKYVMDYELALRFYRNNVSFYYIPSILANARLLGISDRNWKAGINEAKKAKIENGILKKKALYYSYYQYIRGYISRLLINYKLLGFLKFYRKYMSITKKEI